MALLDNGTQINTIMPGFIENHSLDVEPTRASISFSLITFMMWPIMGVPRITGTCATKLDKSRADESSAQAWETPSLDLLAMS